MDAAALCYMLAFIIPMIVILYEGRKLNLNPVMLLLVIDVTLIFGFVGAKLLFVVLSSPDLFVFSKLKSIDLFLGGTVSYGGYLGGLFGLILFSFFKRIDVHKILEAYAPALAIGIVLGRISCFLRGCCFGSPSSLPWAVFIACPPNSDREWLGVSSSMAELCPIHPVQLYESILTFILLLFIIGVNQKKSIVGKIIYLGFGYPVIRIFTDSFRGDMSVQYLNLYPSQWFFILIFALTACYYLFGFKFYLHKLQRSIP